MLTSHIHLHLCECTCIVIDTPVIKNERNNHRIKFELPAIIHEWGDENPKQKYKVNQKYYVHL
jgi:hypothetical protein